MTKSTQQFNGTLMRMPFSGKPAKSEATMLPLTTNNDYEVFAQFSCSDHPVLLNVSQHYQILSDLVARANEHWPDNTCLVRVSMPGGRRIPVNLLAANVLLVEDVGAQEQQLVSQPGVVLVVDNRLGRIEIENHDNTLSLRLYSDEVLADDALAPLIGYLQSQGVE